VADQKRIIFLYTELANYFLVCIKQLQVQYNAQIHIIHWPVNPEAPFKFDFDIPGVYFHNKQDLEGNKMRELVEQVNPHLIYCSGWIDKKYMSICKLFRNKIPVISGLDTQWSGNIKQQLGTLVSRFTIKKCFSHIWIAGQPQLKYAQKLGYDPAHILHGVYAADTDYFGDIYNRIKEKKRENFPKRFIYVGRYLEFKGIYDLWAAFKKANEQVADKWELWCLGTGAEWNKRIEDKYIQHLGFIQPNDMEKYMEQTAVFVLPSRFEPWAVALHEYCAAGFPVICSDKVGSATKFIESNKNGLIFSAGNVEELAKCFRLVMTMPQEKILQWGQKSHELAKTMTPHTWASTIMSVL
jgi:glycosyltransferase involved in cell wall biosynthesis